MKKIQMVFVVAASLLGVGGAFATTARIDCTQDIQFKDAQGTPVTPMYDCVGNTPTCTWHKVGQSFTPCRRGVYKTPPPALKDDKK